MPHSQFQPKNLTQKSKLSRSHSISLTHITWPLAIITGNIRGRITFTSPPLLSSSDILNYSEHSLGRTSFLTGSKAISFSSSATTERSFLPRRQASPAHRHHSQGKRSWSLSSRHAPSDQNSGAHLTTRMRSIHVRLSPAHTSRPERRL